METEVCLGLVGRGVRRQDNERESSKPLRTELCGRTEGGMTKLSLSWVTVGFVITQLGTCNVVMWPW